MFYIYLKYLSKQKYSNGRFDHFGSCSIKRRSVERGMLHDLEIARSEIYLETRSLLVAVRGIYRPRWNSSNGLKQSSQVRPLRLLNGPIPILIFETVLLPRQASRVLFANEN